MDLERSKIFAEIVKTLIACTASFSSVARMCSLPTMFLIIKQYNLARLGKAGTVGWSCHYSLQYLTP